MKSKVMQFLEMSVFGLGSLVAAVVLLLGTTAAIAGGDGDDYAFGTPNKITLSSWPDPNETQITFGIVADTHVDPVACGDKDSDNMQRNRNVISDLNKDCTAPTGAPFADGHVKRSCSSIVLLGDMMHSIAGETVISAQRLIAFRQLWENDYGQSPNIGELHHRFGGACDDRPLRSGDKPGSNAYSQGFRISFPVIPMLGNHDVIPPGPTKSSGYLNQRIHGANHILSSYAPPGSKDPSNFIWRCGKYVFVTLGRWAGGFDQDNTNTDDTKLLWLQNWLRDNRVREDNLGVLIFQHYGWDSQSKNGYWNETQRQQMVNILRGRDRNDAVSSDKQPYNVLGVFTGHIHWPQQWIPVYDKDKPVFTNYSMLSSGATGSGRQEYGFSVVRLDGQNMWIHTKERKRYWDVTHVDIKVGH
jgi:hypothetical protein